MKQYFAVFGYHATSERDSFENGCIGPYKSEFMGRNDWSLQASTLAELTKALCEEFKAEPDEITLNACDEPGRLDIQVNQREPFERARPSAKTMEKWKAGEIDLWLTDYSFNVEMITTEMDLQLIFDTEKEMKNAQAN